LHHRTETQWKRKNPEGRTSPCQAIARKDGGDEKKEALSKEGDEGSVRENTEQTMGETNEISASATSFPLEINRGASPPVLERPRIGWGKPRSGKSY